MNVMKIWQFAFAAILLSACRAEKTPIPFSVIPYPHEVEFSDGVFDMAGSRFIVDPSVDAASLSYISKFSDELSCVSGRRSPVVRGVSGRGVRFILDAALPDEAYTIDVTGKSAVIGSSSYRGFVWAIQTLRQMLPVSIY